MRAAAATIVALLAAALAAGPAGGAPACSECGRAGIGRAALAVPEGTPLAGYGSLTRRLLMPDLFGRRPHAYWFKPHQGQLDPIFARALVVEHGADRLIWLTADLIAVDRAFTARVAAALAGAGISGRVVISASHTHSGPGAFLDSRVFGALAVDDEDPVVRDAVVAGLVQAAHQASGSMTAARLGALTVDGPPLTTGRLGHPVDRDVIVVKVADASGKPIGLLWNFAIHGTMLGPRNLKLSGDVMGLASRRLEQRLGLPVLYVNGAVGDVSPARHGAHEVATAADELAAVVEAAWSRVAAARPMTLRVVARSIRLPAPRLSLRNCVGRWVPAAFRLPLDAVFPRDAELIAGRLGELAWVTIPGELQSELGATIKRARAAPAAATMVAGVSNDYLGYFVTPVDYGTPSYVTCGSLYGAKAGERLAGAAVDLLRSLGQGAR